MSVVDNFLSHEELQKVHELINEKGYTFGWKSNVNQEARHWNCRFGGNPNHTQDEEIRKYDINEFLWDIWERIAGSPPERKLVRLYSNGYTYGNEGAAHYDSTTPGCITHLIYINDFWKPEWAGETVFFNSTNDEIVKSVLPKPGRLVEFDGRVYHAARSVSKFFVGVRQILVYKSIPL